MKKIMIIAAVVATAVCGFAEEKVPVVETTVLSNYVSKTGYYVANAVKMVEAGLKDKALKDATVNVVLTHSSAVAKPIIDNNCWYKALNSREQQILDMDKTLVEQVIKSTDGVQKLAATLQWVDNYGTK